MNATQKLTTIERSLLARKGDAAPLALSEDQLAEKRPMTVTPDPGVIPSAEILIIEDNRLNLKLYRDLLEIRGHQIAHSNHPKQILSAMRLSRPDLILVDISAARRTELEIAREIKRDQEFRQIPMIGIAELYREGSKAEIMEDGCDACLAKPISVAEFLKVVEDYLKQSPPEHGFERPFLQAHP